MSLLTKMIECLEKSLLARWLEALILGEDLCKVRCFKKTCGMLSDVVSEYAAVEY